MRNERKYAWTERGEERRKEASGGEREQRREVEEQLREDRRRKGDREGGKLRGRYPGGHWPMYNIYVNYVNYVGPIVMRRNVLFDRWVK